MARPTKPLSLVQGHRTKAEKSVRAAAEAGLITGEQMREWPQTVDNPVAHKHFTRIRKLLKKIDKNDALYESAINRYCVLLAEVAGFEKMQMDMHRLVAKLEERSEEMDIDEYMTKVMGLNQQLLKCDQTIQAKRKMLLDIERENIMTVASALRSIPKKPEEKAISRMGSMLRGG